MYEHTIAVLIGKPPAVFTLPPDPNTIAAPTIPAISSLLPSELLERHPDIASSERSIADVTRGVQVTRQPAEHQ
jgi:outer membrane protein TolC